MAESTDVQRLADFIRGLTWRQLRRISRPCDGLLLPSGGLLRGFRVVDGLYLARDRRLWVTTPGSKVVQPATPEKALQLVSLDSFRARVLAKAFAARESLRNKP